MNDKNGNNILNSIVNDELKWLIWSECQVSVIRLLDLFCYFFLFWWLDWIVGICLDFVEGIVCVFAIIQDIVCIDQLYGTDSCVSQCHSDFHDEINEW